MIMKNNKYKYQRLVQKKYRLFNKKVFRHDLDNKSSVHKLKVNFVKNIFKTLKIVKVTVKE